MAQDLKKRRTQESEGVGSCPDAEPVQQDVPKLVPRAATAIPKQMPTQEQQVNSSQIAAPSATLTPAASPFDAPLPTAKAAAPTLVPAKQMPTQEQQVTQQVIPTSVPAKQMQNQEAMQVHLVSRCVGG